MAAHLGGVTREMSADSFASSLSDAIHAGGGSKPTAVPLLVHRQQALLPAVAAADHRRCLHLPLLYLNFTT